MWVVTFSDDPHCLTEIFLSPLQAYVFLRLRSCLSFKTSTSFVFLGDKEVQRLE
jgi:hypothetical protein